MFDYLYEWDNLREGSPEEDVRNYWLFHYGAFGCWRGIWFACNVVRRNVNNSPYSVVVIPVAGEPDPAIYPTGEVKVEDMDVLYSVFPNGQSIKYYIERAMYRKHITDKMLNAALRRSLNTEVITAPKKALQSVKNAANRQDKEEIFVVTEAVADEIKVVEIPRTIDIVEKLWNSNDWAIQEISQLLGISYNPAHGKKERMLQNELLGDRDLTLMNRRKLSMRLITAAKKYGESVRHISTSIDTIDRGLAYEKEDGMNVGNESVEPVESNMESAATRTDQIK